MTEPICFYYAGRVGSFHLLFMFNMAISFILAIEDPIVVMSIDCTMLISRAQAFDFSVDELCHPGQEEVQ